MGNEVVTNSLYHRARSRFSTAKKQGWNVIDALTCDPANLAKSLRLS
jgi:hypothetical protein